MQTELSTNKEESLKELGLSNLGSVYWDLSTAALYEEAIRRYEGIVSHLGPLVMRTGQYTGRLPKDKFLVREPSSENKIWWGKVNRTSRSTGSRRSRIGCAPTCKVRIFSYKIVMRAPTNNFVSRS